MASVVLECGLVGVIGRMWPSEGLIQEPHERVRLGRAGRQVKRFLELGLSQGKLALA